MNVMHLSKSWKSAKWEDCHRPSQSLMRLSCVRAMDIDLDCETQIMSLDAPHCSSTDAAVSKSVEILTPCNQVV